ncbi:vasohibin-2 [Geranomyces variabilis]|nr:vasohibin-2 [Geranomyces variabilis]KAJ3136037.1 Tubulinyl-Tyr carboxypeptidase 1 [Geranomyces variabilis]
MEDHPHPESFTPEKWDNLLTACTSRIQMSGGLPAVLRSMDMTTAGGVATDDDLHAAVKALVKQAGAGGGVGAVPRPPAVGGGVLAGAAVGERLRAVQTYIDKLGYNHLGTTFFEIRKTASVRSLMRTAQEMISFALPIKCLEAVVLATYLTAPLVDVERIPCSFKSECGGDTYRHIVLLLHCGDRWGALGISRRPDLMDKPLAFKSLPEILKEYKTAYERNGHRLRKIKLGLPITHDTSSNERFTWKYLSLHVNTPLVADEGERMLDKYIRGLRGGFAPHI